MTETVRFSKICVEDLALGYGTRSVRLANQAVYNLAEIHLSAFFLLKRLTLSAVNGNAVLTWTAGYPALARIWGVTAKVLTGFGATGGLTGLLIGDGTLNDRWSRVAIALTLATETSQGDFSSSDTPIYASATDILVSAIGGTFDATGAIELACYYSLLRHPA
jgi:hypothetical protein